MVDCRGSLRLGDAKDRMPMARLKTSFQFRTTDPKRAGESFGQAFRWTLLDPTSTQDGSNLLAGGPIRQPTNVATTCRFANPFQLSEPRVQAPLHLASLSVSARVAGRRRSRPLLMASARVRGRPPAS
jgi:hypothetical protein